MISNFKVSWCFLVYLALASDYYHLDDQIMLSLKGVVLFFFFFFVSNRTNPKEKTYQLVLARMSPSIDPIKATTVTSKQTMLKVWRTTHFLVQVPIFFCTKYISTGKYIAKGQRFNAPNTPKISLKYGNTIPSPVVVATYAVRMHSLKRFKWKAGKNGNLQV